MNIDKYNIKYLKTIYKNRPIFVFVNHKTAVLCWTKMSDKLRDKPKVITFDSHRDFYGGLIVGKENSLPYFKSKYMENKELPHFTECEDFMKWDLKDEIQNKDFISEQKRFLTITNDNFIDVAFMKNIVSNVYWYYLEAPFGGKSGKCDDFRGKDHLFVKSSIKRIEKLKEPFILDVDLDFFAREVDFKKDLFPDETINEYLELQEKLFSNSLCLGMTISLEPFWCGGNNNCLSILEKLCKKFDFNLISEAKRLIKEAIK